MGFICMTTEKVFSYQKLRTYTRFHEEAWGNWDMAYLLTLSGIRRRPAPLLCCIPMRHVVSLFFLTAIASSFLGVKNMWPRECHKPQDVIKVTLFNRIVSNFHRKKSLKDRHIFWTPLSFLTPSSFQPMVGVICSAPHPRGHFSIDMWYVVSGF